MSIHKITPFLSDIKDFFKNSDMTAAMQNIISILAQVRMTERDTLAVTSKHNCMYRLLTVFPYPKFTAEKNLPSCLKACRYKIIVP